MRAWRLLGSTRHTAAGVVLLGPEPLFPLGDLDPLGLLGLPGLCNFFRPRFSGRLLALLATGC